MKKSYTIERFEWMNAERLEPHPEALIPIQHEDVVSVHRSVLDHGIFKPLLVLAEPTAAGRHQIVDGCNRWNAAKGGDVLLPCILIACTDVRAVVLECLGAGRKRSTGQRILAYLELHKPQVLAAADANAGEGSLRSHDRREKSGDLGKFSAERIAFDLAVSDKDVRLAIELLRCKERRLCPPVRVGPLVQGERALDLQNKEDQTIAAAVEQTYAGVLAGGTPVRRWKAGVCGIATTAGGRPDVDYAMVFKKGIQHVRTGIGQWQQLSLDDRKSIIHAWHKLREILPDDLRF